MAHPYRIYLHRFLLLTTMVCWVGWGWAQKGDRHRTPPPPAQILHLLPDTSLYNHFGDHVGLKLEPEQLRLLLEQGAVQVNESCTWRLTFQDSSHSHLRIDREGMEDGLSYDLMLLPYRSRKPLYLVVQRYGDHCCSFFSWATYQWEMGSLEDVSQATLPVPRWDDLFPDSLVENGWPPPMQGNRYPLRAELASNPVQITLWPVADWLGYEVPEGIALRLEAAIPQDGKALIWTKKGWTWR